MDHHASEALRRAAKRSELRSNLCVAIQEVVTVVHKPRKAEHFCARRQRSPLYNGLRLHGLHLAWVHRHAFLRESVAQEAELLQLEPKLALGALGIELLMTEDLKHLRNDEQVLQQGRLMRQAVVHIEKSTPAQWL